MATGPTWHPRVPARYRRRGLTDTTGGWLAGGEEPSHGRPTPAFCSVNRPNATNHLDTTAPTHACADPWQSSNAQPPARSSRAPSHPPPPNQHEGPSGPAPSTIGPPSPSRSPSTCAAQPPLRHLSITFISSIHRPSIGLNSRHGCSLILARNDTKTTCTRDGSAALQLITSF